jgi:hypothetical protein
MAVAATVLQGGMHGVTEQSLSQPSVAVGAIVALRLFDVAYAIDLARAEALLAQQARASRRIRLSTTPPKAMAFGVPPLALELNPIADDRAACADHGRGVARFRSPAERGR